MQVDYQLPRFSLSLNQSPWLLLQLVCFKMQDFFGFISLLVCFISIIIIIVFLDPCSSHLFDSNFYLGLLSIYIFQLTQLFSVNRLPLDHLLVWAHESWFWTSLEQQSKRHALLKMSESHDTQKSDTIFILSVENRHALI